MQHPDEHSIHGPLPTANSMHCRLLAYSLSHARKQARTKISCSLNALSLAFLSDEWRQDNEFRCMLIYVIELNLGNGMRHGLTDEEDELMMGMRKKLAAG